jgi:hypothetical protein
MRNFIDRHFFLIFGMGFLTLPIGAAVLAACSAPDTAEEKVEMDTRYTDLLKDDLVTIIPEPGVKCFVLRGTRASEPRTMSCVVIPKETK